MQQVGRSEHTRIKQEHFKYFLDVHLKISKASMFRNRWMNRKFFYADIFAGDGGKETCDGSPVIFEQCNTEHGVKCSPLFIEENPVTAKRLEKKVKSPIINAPNEKILPQITPEKGQLGLLYVDPNGDPPFDLLENFYNKQNTNQVDLLIYYSGTTIKRALKAPTAGRDISLKENIQRLPKKHWLIRSKIGKFQWSFLFGTSWVGFPEFNKIGFHNVHSKKGQHILNQVNYTAKELKKMSTPKSVKQLNLFEEPI